MILNPTHSRMGNCGSVQAWRQFLSRDGRIYLSASNWDLTAGQRPSPTLHSFWHNGEPTASAYAIENGSLCYREWNIPSP
jgi:hypothetical protein